MKNKTGFTLIELLVAITIGMVLIGVGSVSLNQFNEKQKFEAVKDELLTNLRLARNYAITNQLPTGGNRTEVTFDVNGLMKINSLDAGDTGSQTLFSKDISPNGISISVNPFIKFSVTDGRSIGGTVVVTIVGDDLVTKVINIDQSGLIYEKQ